MYALSLARHNGRVKAAAASRSSQLCGGRSALPRASGISAPSFSGVRTSSKTLCDAGALMWRRQVVVKAFVSGAKGFRTYSTSKAPESVVEAANDSFVSSAVVPPVNFEPGSGLLGVNEGFTKLMDPVYWNNLMDPLFWFFQGNIELIHTLSGLPWWGGILAYALALRVISFPLQIQQTRLSAISTRMQPKLLEIRKKYMYAGGKGEGWGEAAQQMQLESREVMAKAGVSPFTAFKFTIPQAFMTIGSFVVIRSVANEPASFLHSQWLTGGTAWFENMCVADPTLLLPAASCLATAGIFLVTPMPQFSKRTVLLLSAGLSGLMFFVTYGFPIALQLFWLGSSSITVATTALLRINAVRRALNIPLLDAADEASAAAEKPVLFDTPLSQRSKEGRVATPPASSDASSSPTPKTPPPKKKTRN